MLCVNNEVYTTISAHPGKIKINVPDSFLLLSLIYARYCYAAPESSVPVVFNYVLSSFNNNDVLPTRNSISEMSKRKSHMNCRCQ